MSDMIGSVRAVGVMKHLCGQQINWCLYFARLRKRNRGEKRAEHTECVRVLRLFIAHE